MGKVNTRKVALARDKITYLLDAYLECLGFFEGRDYPNGTIADEGDYHDFTDSLDEILVQLQMETRDVQ